ncbi:UDP-N-acetylglucosamine--N-acetylmuramyl-(pentapeptide) pyrophosphoryl-undecaprenol N-acetylglucosamine transferase, partial [Campylobacter jejuni]|nr:UDP-N-acetylglucosamine--N-acetylmuramyl-(pentapeptide) pyrophosphoryl-undecaprenol N-acetylglucosamine transferase [Campylobacter jejuni]
QNSINLDEFFKSILKLNLENISTRLQNITQKNGADMLIQKALFDNLTFIR